MKTLIIALLLVSSATAQTRAQLKLEIQSLRDTVQQLEQQIEENHAANEKLTKFLVDQYIDQWNQITELKSEVELLKIANKGLADVIRTPLPAMLPDPILPVVAEPVRPVIHIEPPAPALPSPVHCSGYEIPIRGGITLTNQNCH